jgi:hypothetical protein
MKLRSYTLLFRLFSFLSDKTNGASFFVKYKILLGTLIMGLVSTSANGSKKEMMCNIQIEEKPHTEDVSNYITADGTGRSISDSVKIKGTVIDKSGEPVIATSVIIKNSTKGTMTDIDGKFELNALPTDSLIFSFIGYQSQTISVSDLKENQAIVMEEDGLELSCYIVAVAEANPSLRNRNTSFYAVTTIEREESGSLSSLPYLYTELQTPPVSPVGNRDEFKKWIERNIIYNKQMRKNKVHGQLILSFIVDEKGNIVDKKILSKLSPEADTEALRVLSSSDKWTPGMQNGKKVKTIISIPVNF